MKYLPLWRWIPNETTQPYLTATIMFFVNPQLSFKERNWSCGSFFSCGTNTFLEKKECSEFYYYALCGYLSKALVHWIYVAVRSSSTFHCILPAIFPHLVPGFLSAGSDGWPAFSIKEIPILISCQFILPWASVNCSQAHDSQMEECTHTNKRMCVLTQKSVQTVSTLAFGVIFFHSSLCRMLVRRDVFNIGLRWQLHHVPVNDK